MKNYLTKAMRLEKGLTILRQIANETDPKVKQSFVEAAIIMLDGSKRSGETKLERNYAVAPRSAATKHARSLRKTTLRTMSGSYIWKDGVHI